jgi:hypothetical protein
MAISPAKKAWWTDQVVVELHQNPLFESGACLALCADWLAHNLGAPDNPVTSAEDIWKIQEDSEKLFLRFRDSVDYADELQSYSVFKEFGLWVDQKVTGERMDATLLAKRSYQMGGSQLISFWEEEGGDGHTVATKIGMVFFEFLDPDLGYFSKKKRLIMR